MIEIADYPRVSSLLHDLLELEPDDEGLGLEVLMNLYRPRLQAPLLGLAHLVEARDWQTLRKLRAPEILSVLAENTLADRYPALDSGRLFSMDEGLAKIFDQDGYRGAGIKYSTALNKVVKDGITIHLCYQSRKGWRTYDHLVLLHRLGWDQPNRDYLLAALEIELGITPAVRESALDLAQQAD